MSIPIPPERIPPIAKEVADAKKTWAILWWFGAALACLIAYGKHDTATGQDGSSMVAGVLFWVIVLFALGVRQWKLGKRASEAARRATESGTSFVLAGNLLVAVDERQVSQPSASFKISGKHVTMLTALPVAQLPQ